VVVPWMLQVASRYTKRSYMRRGIVLDHLRFVKHARIALPISAFLSLAAILLLSFLGLRLSTDFTGGQSVLLRVPDTTDVANVRTVLDGPEFAQVTAGAAAIVEVDDPTVAGRLLSVRVGLTESASSAEVFPNQLATALEGEVLSADFVGPAVGADLRRGAVLAVLVALALILVYVSWRFWPNWTVAIGTVVATLHDVGLVLGFLDLVRAEFSIPVLAALLFVVGYSLNDSVVISDRIRENLGKVRDRGFRDIVDLSVGQTLSRTIITSTTTLLPVLSLFFFGGAVLRDFSMTLLVGVLVGTYSSLFVLAPLVVYLGTYQRRRRRARRTATASA